MEGPAEQENLQASRIASATTEHYVNSIDQGTIEKIPWFRTPKKDSPMFLWSKYVKGTTYHVALFPKLIEPLSAAQHRPGQAKLENQQRQKAAADKINRRHDAREALAPASVQREFQPVESGIGAPAPHRLQPVIQELSEDDEARETFVDNMVGVWLNNPPKRL